MKLEYLTYCINQFFR